MANELAKRLGWLLVRRGVRGRALAPLAVVVVALASSVTAFVTPSVAVSTGANLVTNSCIATPSLSSEWEHIPPDSTEIPGWNVGGGGVSAVAKIYERSAPGCSQSVVLAAFTSGWIAQTVQTTPGATYVLRWEMAGNLGGPALKTMDVSWQDRLVAKETFNTTGHTPSDMGWAIQRVTVTASASRSVVEFADATVGHANFGAMVDAVSLTLQPGPAVVNGFSVTPFAGPYGVAEREMLSEIKAHEVVPVSGAPICTLVAAAADVVQSGAGLLIIWSIAPTAEFIHKASTARLASAQAVEQYLAELLKTSRSLYLTALNADRVPLQGRADLAHWWGVEVRSISTTGSPQSYQIAAKTGSAVTETWSGIFGINSTSGAPQALANLLYYTKSIAAAPGPTISSS